MPDLESTVEGVHETVQKVKETIDHTANWLKWGITIVVGVALGATVYSVWFRRDDDEER